MLQHTLNNIHGPRSNFLYTPRKKNSSHCLQTESCQRPLQNIDKFILYYKDINKILATNIILYTDVFERIVVKAKKLGPCILELPK